MRSHLSFRLIPGMPLLGTLLLGLFLAAAGSARPSQADDTPAAQAPSAQDYDAGYTKATTTITEVQKLMDAKDYGAARAKARAFVISIHEMAGIETKTALIPAEDLLGSGDIKLRFADLTDAQRIPA